MSESRGKFYIGNLILMLEVLTQVHVNLHIFTDMLGKTAKKGPKSDLLIEVDADKFVF